MFSAKCKMYMQMFLCRHINFTCVVKVLTTIVPAFCIW